MLQKYPSTSQLLSVWRTFVPDDKDSRIPTHGVDVSFDIRHNVFDKLEATKVS